MAIDKEKLLAYFQSHYLSRQEVLGRLPLNIPIDSFWQELLNRRKARATILPLYNAAGMPYWYVLTDRMVTASERLCEEALVQDADFDPYRAGMTSAMTEEMFFTSFVEGAQIPLQEAMDFLQRGTEPESIQEQMIWNNRRAWAELSATIYRPLDGDFVRALAFMLTEEMDDCAENYRQIDLHPIAAMNNEAYDVPPAYILHDRMDEYYAFLQKPDIHPLVKAAVAQAYLLVTRPFPEGNERLSRMMSAAVLLRCGYDFFRDISISAVIAKESYQYYKCMREIIRTENGGDLTYFVQYYLELLVRALDARNERRRKREQEALDREQQALAQERELARQPLSTEAEEEEATAQPPENDVPPVSEKPGDEQQTFEPDFPVPENVNEFLAIVDRMQSSPRIKVPTALNRVRNMLYSGMAQFTVAQWAEYHKIDRKNADYECRHFYRKGLLVRFVNDKVITYGFRIAHLDLDENSQEPAEDDSLEGPAADNIGESPPENSMFFIRLRLFEASGRDNYSHAGNVIREMAVKGQLMFSRELLQATLGISRKRANALCVALIKAELLVKAGQKGRTPVYSLTVRNYPSLETPGLEMMDRLHELETHSESVRDNRIGAYLLSRIAENRLWFTTSEWVRDTAISQTAAVSDIRRALNRGFIRKYQMKSSGNCCIYLINAKPQTEITLDNMIPRNREYISRLYGEFGSGLFSVEQCAELLGITPSSAYFNLNNFTECGIMDCHVRPGRASSYQFKVTPADHPDCFESTSPAAKPVRRNATPSYSLAASA